MRRTRTDDTRTRVLDAALSVYEREGHGGFNVHAIARRSKTSLGSMYHHFGSMDGLAAALYERCMADLLDHIASSLSRVRTLRSGVRAIIGAYANFAETERAAMLFIHASAYASYLPAHAEQIAATKAPRLAAIFAFFERHAAAGSIVSLPPELLEVLVMGPIFELTRRWLAGDEAIDLARALRLLPERVCRAIER
jgi:AcrR family transcriptional regulator